MQAWDKHNFLQKEIRTGNSRVVLLLGLEAQPAAELRERSERNDRLQG
jgi:hypothetical protein